jgi:N6-L-threonylcarbamoyladenine synthase
MKILGIETSCDETSVALVEDGHVVLSNLIASQVRIHARFGGVVPEVASRAHLQQLLPMVDECLSRHDMSLAEVDALAVTRGPGLVGALLVGVETAKALAWATRKPLIPVHHIAAHLYAPFLKGDPSASQTTMMGNSPTDQSVHAAHAAADIPAPHTSGPTPDPLTYPYMGLVVSGGHTSLIHVHSPLRHTVLAETVDDAAGEAFDKTAKLLELGYPGGPLVSARARGGDRARFKLPRPMLAGSGIQFSFSGLKTAVGKIIREVGLLPTNGFVRLPPNICPVIRPSFPRRSSAPTTPP